MRLAFATYHFDANHSVRLIKTVFYFRIFLGGSFANRHSAHDSVARLGEARPATMRLKLRRRLEQNLVANDARVMARFKMIPILAGEGSLGTGILSHTKLFWCKPLSQGISVFCHSSKIMPLFGAPEKQMSTRPRALLP